VIYIELTHPLGRRELVAFAAYVELPTEALRGTRARLVTRVEAIKARVNERSGG
jgi:hypothetical protein